ncbi:restriction endonuclease subunit S [Staphylococcus equorum]|uniref:restriction endonuclease subunit S n=1 Tax=Staphylococcus TaxID=1279 RepID=UPI0025541270|nr:restriction endonuclease subunit S [Staphylococcus equorum]MDK9877442.1 restriction endonuclease subunit S [Staphylococcus equorum]
MTEIANTPELRFPNYENSWFSYKLNDISERVTRKNKNLESQRPLTISGQLGLIDQIEYFNKSVSSKNLTGYTLIKKGEFAYNKSYSNGYPLGAIKKLERYDLGILSSLYICFSFDENIDKSFMKNYFESTKWYREVANIAVEGARNHGLLNIPVNDFFNININLPIQYEQEKIGEFFSKLDRQIELEEQKLEKLEEQKKGYMQDIFSQQLRFKDENGNDYPEWKEKKLYDVVKYLSSKHSSNHYSENIINGEYPVYDAIREISRDINFDVEKSYISILKDGAGVGRLNLRPGKSSVIGTMGYILPQNIDINFLFYYLKTMNFSKYVIGSTIPHLYFKDYSKETILVPIDKNEQIKIGSFLIKLDHIIENKVKKIEILKKRKQGFLQKMFV